MPFAPSIMNEEEELKKKNQNGVNVSGTSTSFATGVPGQQSASGARAKAGSGDKFANIQSYLDANKEQGNRMGSQMAGTVSANAEDATQKINQFQSTAPKVESYDPNEAYQNVTSLSDEQKSAYNQAKGGYTGPQNLDSVSGYSDAQKATTKAANQVQNAGTEQGQRELLKETFKRPSYSAGSNALDQTIIQNSPGSKKAFEDLTQKYAGLNSLFDNASTAVGEQVNQNIQTGLANQKAIAEGEAREMTNLMDPIRARAMAQTAENASRINAISGDITDDVLSADTLAALGLTGGTRLLDMDLSDYLTPDYTQVGVNNAANADERAKYAALTALINGTAGSDITADGKAINPVNFDKSRFDQDFASKQAELDEIAKNTTFNTSQYGGDRNADWSVASGKVNLADYLARGDAALNIGKAMYMGGSVGSMGDDAIQAQNAARADLKRQLDRWLAENKYNRTITQG